jgi:hypothetical protein
VRAGGGRASLINLGVLVTYIHTPSPAVGVRRNVRIIAYGVAVREMRFGRSKPARGTTQVILRCCVVTDIVRVPASAFVSSVTVVDAWLQRPRNHHFNIVSEHDHKKLEVTDIHFGPNLDVRHPNPFWVLCDIQIDS